MAKPTPDSRLTSVLLPLQKKVFPDPISQSSPSSASRVSLSAMSMLYRWSYLATSAVRRCGLSDVSLSSTVRTFHAPMPCPHAMEVSSALLNRAAQSLRWLPDSTAALCQW
ncbi:craniofacial development protein 2 [Biomphalaria glabrata]|nr:Biomphalaria glabrata craniofacial development protein 2-like [Biomphalaria glabrata]